MSALSSLLNILDAVDKHAHQNRAKETTVFWCAWVIDGAGQCASYNVFPTIYSNHEGCVCPKSQVNIAVSLKRVQYSWSCLMKAASLCLPQRLAWDSLLKVPHTPDLEITTQLRGWINGWWCLSHVSNWKRICSAVAMIGSILQHHLRVKHQADSLCILPEGRQGTWAAICGKGTEIKCNGQFEFCFFGGMIDTLWKNASLHSCRIKGWKTYTEIDWCF